jgi:plastocyanin
VNGLRRGLLVASAAGAIAARAVPALADGGVLRGTVTVARPEGVPAGPVLVYVVGFTERAPSTAVVVKQVGKRFDPDLIAATAGQTLEFPNGDPFLHNVFSPSSERSFDLGSYPRGDSRSRTFPRPDVIDIFCNIHPEMSATLVVLPNTRFAIAAPDGRFAIGNVPVGTWTVFAYSRRATRPVRAKVTITAGAPTEVELRLDEVPRDFAHPNKYGEPYRDDTTIYAPGS